VPLACRESLLLLLTNCLAAGSVVNVLPAPSARTSAKRLPQRRSSLHHVWLPKPNEPVGTLIDERTVEGRAIQCQRSGMGQYTRRCRELRSRPGKLSRSGICCRSRWLTVTWPSALQYAGACCLNGISVGVTRLNVLIVSVLVLPALEIVTRPPRSPLFKRFPPFSRQKLSCPDRKRSWLKVAVHLHKEPESEEQWCLLG